MLQVIDAHRQVPHRHRDGLGGINSIGVNLAPEARRARRSKVSLEPSGPTRVLISTVVVPRRGAEICAPAGDRALPGIRRERARRSLTVFVRGRRRER